MTIQAGRLRHRIKIQHQVDVLDSNGDVEQNMEDGSVLREWVTFHECWAAIEPLSGKEFIQSQALQSAISARLVIRFIDGINAGMRALHEPLGRSAVVYNIHGVLADKDSGMEYLTLPVGEGVNPNGA
jgi:SPP1 family predicted phage head-tail adaptor